MTGIDLNLKRHESHLSGQYRKRASHVFKQNRFVPGDGSSADEGVSPLRRSLPRPPQGSELFLSRSVSLDGLCSTHISGELARYRSLSSSATNEALSHGNPERRISQRPCLCQRNAGLEDSRLSSPVFDCHRPISVRKGRFWSRTQRNRLRLGFHYHRFVSLRISLGALSEDQGGGQTPHTPRSSRQHPHVHTDQRRQDARRQRLGRDSSGGRFLLRHGSGLSRLRAFVRSRPSLGFLRDQVQKQYGVSQILFSSGRKGDWSSIGSDDCADGFLFFQRLSGQDAKGQVFRRGAGQGSHLLDQHLSSAVSDDRPTLQMSLAGRTLFQMDQAASSDKTFLWNFRECRENSSVDRRLNLRAGCDYEEAIEPGGEPLHNFTDLERDRFRENAHFTGPGGRSLQNAR